MRLHIEPELGPRLADGGDGGLDVTHVHALIDSLQGREVQVAVVRDEHTLVLLDEVRELVPRPQKVHRWGREERSS